MLLIVGAVIPLALVLYFFFNANVGLGPKLALLGIFIGSFVGPALFSGGSVLARPEMWTAVRAGVGIVAFFWTKLADINL